MKNQAFTLIELLVVVLIIGILAVIAVPQYQKSVAKTKYGTLKSYAKSLAQASDGFYLNTGHYPTQFSDLDISFQLDREKSALETNRTFSVIHITGGITCNISADNDQIDGKERKAVGCWRYFNNNTIMSYYQPYTNASDQRRECWAYSDDDNDILNSICKSETGKDSADLRLEEEGANIYYY